MLFSELSQFDDAALVLVRIAIATMFFSSGWRHFSQPLERSKSIEMSVPFTIFLGVAEMAGAAGVFFGVLTQLAALGMSIILLGAIYKKVFQWKTGIWGETGLGWHYDFTFLALNAILIVYGAGKYSLEYVFLTNFF